MRVDVKKCTGCLISKTTDLFFKDKQKSDGFTSRCKECGLKYSKEYKERDVAAFRERIRRRDMSPDRLKKRREYSSKIVRTATRKEYDKKQSQKYRRENIEKVRAHWRVSYEVKSGRMKRMPCSICGSEQRISAHHDDYSKPLDVTWLCPDHHRKRHMELDPLFGRKKDHARG